MGREPTPSGAISARPVGHGHGEGGPPRSDGYDAGKKLTGRKRHPLVDTQGLVLKAPAHPADLHDRDGGRLVREAIPDLPQRSPRPRRLWADAASRGRFVEWVQATFGWSVKVAKRWWTGASAVWVMPGQEPPEIPAGFQLLPRRRIVERTFAWLGRSRRLSKDYEFLPATGEAMIYLAMSRLMLRRLAQSP
jgi:transposase